MNKQLLHHLVRGLTIIVAAILASGGVMPTDSVELVARLATAVVLLALYVAISHMKDEKLKAVIFEEFEATMTATRSMRTVRPMELPEERK